GLVARGRLRARPPKPWRRPCRKSVLASSSECSLVTNSTEHHGEIVGSPSHPAWAGRQGLNENRARASLGLARDALHSNLIGLGYRGRVDDAHVAKLVDALDLKSKGLRPCRFESGRAHQ